MRRHVERELSRARIASAGRAAICDAGAVAERVLGVLRRTPAGAAIDWRMRGPAGLGVRIEADDLTEALGAVLENAGAHARRTVDVGAARDGDMIEFRIRDDGPGVDASRLAELTIRGHAARRQGRRRGARPRDRLGDLRGSRGRVEPAQHRSRPRGDAAAARRAGARFLTIA